MSNHPPVSDTQWSTEWNTIYEFIRSWLKVDFRPEPDLEKLREIEAEIGVSLPPAAREWCFFAWASDQIAPGFSLRDGLTVERVPGHEAISLVLQAEGDTYWAIETQYLEQENPPVTAYYLDYEADDNSFRNEGQWAPTVAAFAFDYLLSYLHSPGGMFAATREAPHYNRGALIADFGEPRTFGHLEYFWGDGMLVFSTDSAGNWNEGQVTIHFQQKTSLTMAPLSIQQLVGKAYLRSYSSEPEKA